MRNIRILIEYDGTKYSGWQYQKNARSIQEELQKAVFTITREAVTVHGAGRTDAGVHARGQVGNFFIQKRISDFDFQKGLNAVLPHDIRIRHLEEAPADFHARFSAKERRYRYYLSSAPMAIGRQYCWFYPHPLDLETMNRAAQHCIGEHDFEAFCSSEAETPHYRCDVYDAFWFRENHQIIFDIRANRFLHNMVRTLTGTLLGVGRGKITIENFLAILESRDRKKAGMTVPAAGLILEEVIYL